MALKKKGLYPNDTESLETYVRMHGYLSAVPEGEKDSRFRAWMQPLPPVGGLSYVWDWMCEVGLGDPIKHIDIKAWSDLTGIKPIRQEVQLITKLSIVWMNERARGSQKGAAAPEAYFKWLHSQN